VTVEPLQIVVADAEILTLTGEAGVTVTLVFAVLLHPLGDVAVTVKTVLAVGVAMIELFVEEGVPEPEGNPAVPAGVPTQLYS
jgi:hypothetical protein